MLYVLAFSDVKSSLLSARVQPRRRTRTTLKEHRGVRRTTDGCCTFSCFLRGARITARRASRGASLMTERSNIDHIYVLSGLLLSGSLLSSSSSSPPLLPLLLLFRLFCWISVVSSGFRLDSYATPGGEKNIAPPSLASWIGAMPLFQSGLARARI